MLDKLTLGRAHCDIEEFIGRAAGQSDKGQGDFWDDHVINSFLGELGPLLGKEF